MVLAVARVLASDQVTEEALARVAAETLAAVIAEMAAADRVAVAAVLITTRSSVAAT